MGFLRRNVSVGLDLGSGHVKLAAIDHSQPEPELVAASTGPLATDAILDGEILDPRAVSDAIRAVVESAALKRAAVIVGIGGHDVIVKHIRMPRTSEATAREAIRWQAEDQVPFDLDGVQLDFQILDPDATDPQMAALVVAAKQELIEDRLRLLRDAGVRPAVVDVNALALHNAFERNHRTATQGLVALVHVGHESTCINLTEAGIPALIREIPLGARHLRERLQGERGLSAADADVLIRGRGTVAVDVVNIAAELADELAIGVERAVAFVTAQSAGSRLERIFFSGGGSRVVGVVEAVRARLGAPCQRLSPFERIAVSPTIGESVDLDDVAPMLTLAVGLALRRPGRGRHDRD